MILVEKLTREFAGVEVLGGLSLTVAEGERLAVRGPERRTALAWSEAWLSTTS